MEEVARSRVRNWLESDISGHHSPLATDLIDSDSDMDSERHSDTDSGSDNDISGDHLQMDANLMDKDSDRDSDIDIGSDIEKNGVNIENLSSEREASVSRTLSFLIIF